MRRVRNHAVCAVTVKILLPSTSELNGQALQDEQASKSGYMANARMAIVDVCTCRSRNEDEVDGLVLGGARCA